MLDFWFLVFLQEADFHHFVYGHLHHLGRHPIVHRPNLRSGQRVIGRAQDFLRIARMLARQIEGALLIAVHETVGLDDGRDGAREQVRIFAKQLLGGAKGPVPIAGHDLPEGNQGVEGRFLCPRHIRLVDV